MKRLKTLAVLVLVIGALYALLQVRGRQVAHWRLRELHLVDPSCQPELLYSSGILRENTHVFQVRRHCLIGEAAKPDDNLTPLQPGDEASAVKLWEVQQAVGKAVRGIDPETCLYFFGFDDPTFTLYYLALSRTDDTVYVVVRSL